MATRTENRYISVYVNGKQVQNNMKSIRKAFYQTNAAVNTLDEGTKAYNREMKNLQKLNKHIQRHRDKVRGISRAWQEVRSVMFGVIGGNLVTSLIQKFQQLGSMAIKGAKELSDQMATVMKVTGMTEQEVKNLSRSLQKMNTRTTRMELLGIAETLGRMGIPKGDIDQATKAMDRLQVALGDEFGTGAKETADILGRLRNVMIDIKTDDFATDLLFLGNAINKMTNEGAATAPILSDFANRIGSVGIPLGLTTGEVIGLSAALQELNVAPERGGTGVVKILQAMTSKTQEFASVAGMEITQFTNLVNTDLFGALLAVSGGMNQSAEKATEFTALLDELGIDGIRTAEVMSKLANNTDFVRQKSEKATEALKNQQTIHAEFERMNTTLAATMEKVQRKLIGAFVNSSVMSGIEIMVDWIAKLVGITNKESVALQDEQIKLRTYQIQLNSTNISTQDRVKLIQELQAKYPKYLGNIDAEKGSLEDLNKALTNINENLVKRIVLTKKQEEIQDQAEVTADRLETLMDAQENLRRIMGETMNDYEQFVLDPQKTELENAAALNKMLVEINEKQTLQGLLVSGTARDAKALYEAYQKVKNAQHAYDYQNDIGGQLQSEFDEMAKLLGISNEGGNEITRQIESNKKVIADSDYEPIKREIIKKMKITEPEADEVWSTIVKSIGGLARDKNFIATVAQFKAEMARVDEARIATLDPYQQQIEAAEKYYDKLIQMAEGHSDLQVQLEEKKAAAIDSIRNKEIQDNIEKYVGHAESAMQIAQNLDAFKRAKEDQELERIRMNSQWELDNIQQKVDQGLISEEQGLREKERLERESLKQELEIIQQQFKREKALNIAQALMNGAMAVAKGIGMFGPPPSPAGIAAIATAGAITATQIAAITAQKPPKYAQGGILDGPLHSEGGMPLIDPRTGTIAAELEGGEVILSRRFSQRYPEFTAAALNSSMTDSPMQLDWIGSVPQYNPPKFERGGVVPSGGSPEVNIDLSGLQSELHAMRADLQNIKFQVSVPYQQILEAGEDYERVKGLGDIG